MKRLLMLVHRVPYPPDKGERVRAFQELRALAPHFEITLAALSHGAADRASAEALAPYCRKIVPRAPPAVSADWSAEHLSLLAGGSVTQGYFRSARLARRLTAETVSDPFDLVFAYSSGVLPTALATPARSRVMDLVDVDSAKWAAYADRARWPMSWVYAREASGVQVLERRAVDTCDRVVLVSKAEAQVLDADNDKLIAVGNGVDTDYFGASDPPSAGSAALVFTGTMDYRPNVEGVLWFVREVWPAVRRELLDATFTIVGRDPTPAVRRLAAVDGVEVTGSVPDVRPYVGLAHVAVAPLLTARGIQNKVLEAMAMARAVVATPAALEGLDVVSGENVVSADGAEAWCRAIVDLHRDEERRIALGRAARQHVIEHYSWNAQMKPLVETRLALAGR